MRAMPGRPKPLLTPVSPPPPSQTIADDNIKAVQASLKASIASLRDEMNRKLQALTIELAQVQKQLNVQRGEQNIVAQQAKDNSKRLDVLAGAVTDLSQELRGEEAAGGY
jgi:peptidoglycan hydrolase CwlO-like protein